MCLFLSLFVCLLACLFVGLLVCMYVRTCVRTYVYNLLKLMFMHTRITKMYTQDHPSVRRAFPQTAKPTETIAPAELQVHPSKRFNL